MLGFAMRAGKVLIGTDTVCASMSRKGAAQIHIVLIPNTASSNAIDKITRRCTAHSVRYCIIDMDAGELGALLGKLYAPSAVAICDEHFATEISRAVTGEE